MLGKVGCLNRPCRIVPSFSFPKQTQPASEFVDQGCDELGSQAQLLREVFFGDDLPELGW